MRLGIIVQTVFCVTLCASVAPAVAQDGSGATVEKKNDFAALWSKAERGDADAMFNLGSIYEAGLGVPRDYKLAVEWYRKAADKGQAGAMNNLGAMHSGGEGVPRDLVLSYMWRNLACALGDSGATRARAALESLMTPSQIEEAQRLSREWSEKHSEIFKAKE